MRNNIGPSGSNTDTSVQSNSVQSTHSTPADTGGRPIQDTPRKSGTPQSTKNQTEHRPEILIQMKNEMVRCLDWEDTGFGHYLPAFQIAEADIDAAVTALKGAKLLKEVPKSRSDVDGPRLRFTQYPTKPSNIQTTGEKRRYRPLVAIGEVLQRLTLTNGWTASCIFLQKPDSQNEAETFGANFKVDALLKLRNSSMPQLDSTSARKIPVADLAVPSEYKTKRDDVQENRTQLLSTTTFCMNDDPRRMHIYGITIEDSTMAVWYFSRSHLAKSPDFDFTEDCRMYIRVMLSLMFATEEELGYDMTIRRCVDPQTRTLCFVYNVNDQYYKTQQAIFDHRSLCITGRATRVWQVVKVESFDDIESLPGSPMVLKDVWLDGGSKTEGDILREIFDDLETIATLLAQGKEPGGFQHMDERSKEALKQCLVERDWTKYFLTILHQSQGVTSKVVAQAAQRDVTLFDKSSFTPLQSYPHTDRSRTATSHPKDMVPPARKQAKRRYSPKQQYRVVFEEVCVALHDIPEFSNVAVALLDCVCALQLLFLAGWVHRDLSSGNVYLFKGRGILADLEYTKRISPAGGQGSSDPKTGTAFFMPVEIQKQAYFYKGPRVSQDFMNPNWSRPSKAPPVTHNFEHDLESVFWLLLWTTLVRFPYHGGTPESEEHLDHLSSEVFQDTGMCPPRREQVLSSDGDLWDILDEYLAPDLAPIARNLERLRDMLITNYFTRQFKVHDMSTYAHLYGYFRHALECCRDLESLPKLLPSRHATAGATSVRPGTAAGVSGPVAKRPLQVDTCADDSPGNERPSKVTRTMGDTDASSFRISST